MFCFTNFFIMGFGLALPEERDEFNNRMKTYDTGH